MKKLTVEYPLNTKSPNIVWGMISTAEGLQKWLADIVVADGKTMTFTWGHPWTDRDTKTSQILECNKFNYIRMKWDYQEADPQAFWEIRLEQSELTGNLNMLITDYADDADIEDLRGIWDDNLDRLHRVSGL
ncbi:MAG: SRPBCC domain-containing protein [Prevotella sp.]|nr:SRPBCC domain-containing protein [Prevotella sp.]